MTQEIAGEEFYLRWETWKLKSGKASGMCSIRERY